jgi:hypothetical protein
MGFNQRFLNSSMFITLMICFVSLFVNLQRIMSIYNVKYSYNELEIKQQQLSLWEQISPNVYHSYPFSVPVFMSLRNFLLRVEDKKILSFEVNNGRAKIVFE